MYDNENGHDRDHDMGYGNDADECDDDDYSCASAECLKTFPWIHMGIL